jgi:hypothetical protein
VGRRPDLACVSLCLVLVSGLARRAARWLIIRLIIQTIRRGSVWIRLDRRGTQLEQARSVWSRPNRCRAPGYGSGDRAPRWVRPSGLRSAVLVWVVLLSAWSWVRCWWTVPLPAGLLPQCPHDPAAVAGFRITGRSGRSVSASRARCRCVRTLGVRRPAPACPGWQRNQAGTSASPTPIPCSNGDCGIPPQSAAAGRSRARAPRPAGCPGGCGTEHPGVRCPLLLPNHGRVPGRLLSAAAIAARAIGSGCPAGIR